jgi:hypothetical protein
MLERGACLLRAGSTLYVPCRKDIGMKFRSSRDAETHRRSRASRIAGAGQSTLSFNALTTIGYLIPDLRLERALATLMRLSGYCAVSPGDRPGIGDHRRRIGFD